MSPLSLLPGPLAPSGLRALVVGAGRLHALTLRRQLERQGHHPTLAAHPHDALARLALHPDAWDVLVVVVEEEPTLSLELLRVALRGREQVAVLIMGVIEEETAQSERLGTAAYLRLPYTAAELDAALARAVGPRQGED